MIFVVLIYNNLIILYIIVKNNNNIFFFLIVTASIAKLIGPSVVTFVIDEILHLNNFYNNNVQTHNIFV